MRDSGLTALRERVEHLHKLSVEATDNGRPALAARKLRHALHLLGWPTPDSTPGPTTVPTTGPLTGPTPGPTMGPTTGPTTDPASAPHPGPGPTPALIPAPGPGSASALDPGESAAAATVTTGHDDLLARLLTSLAHAEAEQGDTALGMELLDAAQHHAPPAQLAIVHAQRGLLHLRMGANTQALHELDIAAPLLVDGDRVELARVLLNRSVIHLMTGRVRLARDDARRSAQLAHAHGHPVLAAKALHNDGYCDLLLGDVPAALRVFAEVESLYEDVNPGFLPVLALDRARALLTVGLTDEAGRTLDRAIDGFRRQRLMQDYAEAELARAQCALDAGRHDEARHWAKQAETHFKRRGSTPWALRAALMRLRCDLAQSRSPATTPGSAPGTPPGTAQGTVAAEASGEAPDATPGEASGKAPSPALGTPAAPARGKPPTPTPDAPSSTPSTPAPDTSSGEIPDPHPGTAPGAVSGAPPGLASGRPSSEAPGAPSAPTLPPAPPPTPPSTPPPVPVSAPAPRASAPGRAPASVARRAAELAARFAALDMRDDGEMARLISIRALIAAGRLPEATPGTPTDEPHRPPDGEPRGAFGGDVSDGESGGVPGGEPRGRSGGEVHGAPGDGRRVAPGGEPRGGPDGDPGEDRAEPSGREGQVASGGLAASGGRVASGDPGESGGRVASGDPGESGGRVASGGWEGSGEGRVASGGRGEFGGREGSGVGRGEVRGREVLVVTQNVRARAARGGSLDVRLMRHLAEAELAGAQGERGLALRKVRDGLALIHSHRGRLGSLDMLTGVAALGADLAAHGLGAALAGGSPRHVFAWSERCRAQAFRFRPPQAPEDPQTAEALAELRQLAQRMHADEAAGQRSPSLRRRCLELEQVIRERGWQLPGAGPRLAPVSAAAVEEALAADDYAMVSLLNVGGGLLALVLARGRCHLHRLSAYEPVAEAARRLAGDLNAQAGRNLRPAMKAVIEASVQRQLGVITDALLAPLRQALSAARGIVLIPTMGLSAVPWGLLPDLRGRPLVVAPSALVWLAARRASASYAGGSYAGGSYAGGSCVGGSYAGETYTGESYAGEPCAGKPYAGGRAPVLVAGPDLEHAEREIEQLGAVHPKAHRLTGELATVSATLAALDGAPFAHFAAHGHHERENVLFSRLDLADGPLMAYDLQRLGKAPGQVVLSACDVGQAVVRAGDELLGFTAALLYLGTSTVISSLTRVPDPVAEQVMMAYHRNVADGARPADALATASADEPASTFVCFGTG